MIEILIPQRLYLYRRPTQTGMKTAVDSSLCVCVLVAEEGFSLLNQRCIYECKPAGTEGSSHDCPSTVVLIGPDGVLW